MLSLSLSQGMKSAGGVDGDHPHLAPKEYNSIYRPTGYCCARAAIVSASRSDSAAMVRVGLAVADVGKTAEPEIKRLG